VTIIVREVPISRGSVWTDGRRVWQSVAESEHAIRRASAFRARNAPDGRDITTIVWEYATADGRAAIGCVIT
jgi:hypothetical protein